ncbi:MAG: beta-propeller domain-containing protein [Deltaproteobacteria bacterium]|nr:beta-propeller domain-containing protein [Deltaproteobacteria bacterium]
MKLTDLNIFKKRTLYFAFTVVFLMTACNDDSTKNWVPMEGTQAVHKLTSFDSSADFLAYVKQASTQKMRAEVELSRNSSVYNLQYSNWDTTAGIGVDYDMGAPTSNGDMEMAIDDGGSADKGASNGDFSTTNIQEEGVDEADLVKTDGNYIYTLYQGELVIVKVEADGALTKTGSLNVGGYATEMFISGDSAVIFSNVSESSVPDSIHYKFNPTPVNYYNYDYGYEDMDYMVPDVDTAAPDEAGVTSSGSAGEIMPLAVTDTPTDPDDITMDTDIAVDPEFEKPMVDDYMYDCSIYGCGGYSYSQIAVVDISDKASPELIRTTTYAGSYVSSRMVDGIVRAVISSSLYALDMAWDYGEEQDWNSEDSINRMYFNVIKVNTDYYNSLTLDDFMPKKISSDETEASYIVNPSNIMAPQSAAGLGLVSVVSIDLATPAKKPVESALFAEQGLVYASQTGLYMTESRDFVSLAMESGLWLNGGNATTGIYKFDISKDVANAQYLASGEVPGRLLNQFSMGEKDGYLRVASTTGDFWGGNPLDNHVVVLKQKGTELKIAGQLDGLGGGEELKSARFVGDKGYLVTFFQTDPLFTIDLSDPANPKKVGEWVGPGFSTYLHPWGDNTIISLGEEDWQGALSIFDISNFSKPELVDRISFGDAYYSSALYDHKAFTFNSKTGYLALPYTGWMNSYYDTGIKTFNLTESKITENASLKFYSDETGNTETEAMRSLYIGDYMYGVSKCRIVSATIADPASVVQSLPLFNSASCVESNYYYYD